MHVRSWQVGYQGLLPRTYLDGLNVTERVARYTFDRMLPDGPVTLVADADDDRVVGFVTVGRCRDDGTPGHGEVWSMYVDPGCWGVGVGRGLIAAAREALSDNHFERAVLWVLAQNSRARRFYERDGWVPDGSCRNDTIGGTAVTHVRYVRGLG